jgi:RecA-family ATPase
VPYSSIQALKISYASDYEVVGKLKQLADRNSICMLLVHHTRKQQADDKFDMISGTNGLLGAADGAFLLQEENRTDDTATLDISGRDQQDQRLYVKKSAAFSAQEPKKIPENHANFLKRSYYEDRTYQASQNHPYLL